MEAVAIGPKCFVRVVVDVVLVHLGARTRSTITTVCHCSDYGVSGYEYEYLPYELRSTEVLLARCIELVRPLAQYVVHRLVFCAVVVAAAVTPAH